MIIDALSDARCVHCGAVGRLHARDRHDVVTTMDGQRVLMLIATCRCAACGRWLDVDIFGQPLGEEVGLLP